MADTYSSKPFITYDGILDGHRAEVKVVTGYGRIKDIEASDKGVAKKVTFSVDNTKYNVSGWSRDATIMKLIEKSKETDEPIYFRIEILRKDHVDRHLPIMELTTGAENARDNARKSLAAVMFEGDADWTVSKDAKTRIDEDPSRGGGSPSAYDIPESERNTKKTSGSSNYSRSGAFEGAPYETYNKGGELNPGSFAVAAPLNIFSYILDYEKEHKIELPKDDRKGLATTILKIANRLQKEIYHKNSGLELSKPDLSAGSHTRARALVFESIRSFAPFTPELVANEEDYTTWKKKVLQISLSMWEWAIDEVHSVLDED